MIDEELKNLLKENVEIGKENLRLLRKMNRARVMGNVFHAFKWLAIIGISFWSYLYIQPYVDSYLKTIENVKSGIGKMGDLGDSVGKFLPK